MKNFFYNSIKRGALFCFGVAIIVILVESGLDGVTSSGQSDAITSVVQDSMNEDYDKDNVIELENFEVKIDNPRENNLYYVNETFTFSITYTPENTSYKDVNYDYDGEILKVNNNVVTCLAPGNTSITFTSVHNEELSQTIDLQIIHKEIESLDFLDNDLTINVGDIYNLNYTVTPFNYTTGEDSFYFESSDPSIVKIDKNTGVLQGISSGNAVISLISKYNETIKDSINVTVNDVDKVVYDIENFTLSKTSYELYDGESSKTKITGSYGPSTSTFDISKVNLVFDENLENILSSTLAINTRNQTFSYTLKAKKQNLTDILSGKATLTYEGFDPIEISISINPLIKLSADLVKDTVKTDYTAYLTYNSYYSDNFNLSRTYVSDMLNIDIPYTFTTANRYKYDTSSYEVIYDSSKLTLTSKSYTLLRFKTKLTDEYSDQVTIKFSDDSSITINYSYKKHDQINYLTYVGIEDFGKEDTIYLQANQTYTNIITSEYEFNESRSSSIISYGLNFAITTSANSYLDSRNIETAGPEEFDLTVTSNYEKQIGVPTDSQLKHVYHIIVEDKPNSYKFSTNSNFEELVEYDEMPKEITIRKNETLSFSYELFWKKSFITNTYEFDIADSSNFELKIVSNSGSISFNASNKIITGLKSGEATISLNSINPNYSYCDVEIKIIVNHTAVDKNKFKFDTKNFEALDVVNEYNDPTGTNYNKVPTGTKFKIAYSMNSDATNNHVVYSSTNSEVISIDENGIAEALVIGSVEIRLTSVDDPSIYITKRIIVTQTTSPIILDENIFQPENLTPIYKDNSDEILYYEATLHYGKTYKIGIKTLSNSTASYVAYTHHDIYDQKIETTCVGVNKDGTISTRDVGEDWIKVYYGDPTYSMNRYFAYIKVNVLRNTRFTFAQLSLLIRKSIGHYGLFLLTALASVIFIMMHFKKERVQAVACGISMVIGFLLAFFSELIQKYTPGRYNSWTDVGIDTAGYATTIIITLIVILVIYLIKKHKKKPQKTEVIEEIQNSENSEK